MLKAKVRANAEPMLSANFIAGRRKIDPNFTPSASLYCACLPYWNDDICRLYSSYILFHQDIGLVYVVGIPNCLLWISFFSVFISLIYYRQLTL